MSDQFDLGSMLAGAMELQQRFEEARASVDRTAFTGTAGGDAVSITVTGNLQVLDVSIAPAVVEAGDVTMLEDLVVAALSDAIARIDQMQQEVMGEFQMPDIGALGDLGGSGGLGSLGALGALGTLDALDAAGASDVIDIEDE